MKARTLYAITLSICTLFALTTGAVAQSVELRHDSKDSDAKATVEQTQPEKEWFYSLEGGYSSKYIFRGTDLTPNSDGISFQDFHVSNRGFTFGLWMGEMIGDAVVPHNTAVGESGGGGSAKPLNIPGFLTLDDTAIQKHFHELDLYFSYFHSFGWIDLTVGNIAFFVEREQIDRFTVTFAGAPPINIDFRSIEDETFDRVFIGLSTHKIPYVVPSLTYYQTIYNTGDGPGADILYFDRNAEKGGYLEGKLAASIPIIKDRLSFDPTAVVSYSFDDRSYATGTFPTALPLTGWNHFQAGAELVWHVNSFVAITAFGNYAHHFAAPTGGTEENMGWGGAKVTLTW
jgi:hypothetical protein